MEVILLENISNLGSLGDKVSVKAGFGRNYLVPQGKAVPATANNIADFEVRRAELEAAAAVGQELGRAGQQFGRQSVALERVAAQQHHIGAEAFGGVFRVPVDDPGGVLRRAGCQPVPSTAGSCAACRQGIPAGASDLYQCQR